MVIWNSNNEDIHGSKYAEETKKFWRKIKSIWEENNNRIYESSNLNKQQ